MSGLFVVRHIMPSDAFFAGRTFTHYTEKDLRETYAARAGAYEKRGGGITSDLDYALVTSGNRKRWPAEQYELVPCKVVLQ